MITIRLKGGKGSGNFGHAGRPGKVGGSVSQSEYWSRFNVDGPTTVYHGTAESAIKSILDSGLKPGDRWMSRNPAVYFTVDRNEASYWSLDRKEVNSNYIVVEFEIPDKFDNDVVADNLANRDLGWKSAHRIEREIPPEYIHGVIVGKMRYVWDKSEPIGYRQIHDEHFLSADEAKKLLSKGKTLKSIKFDKCYAVIFIDDGNVLEEKQQTSTIIALDCSDDPNIKSLGGLVPGNSVEDYHITLSFVGDIPDIDGIKDRLESFSKLQAPVEGKFNGTAMFEDTGDGMPFVLLYDSPQLPFLRQSLREYFGELIPEQEHGFTPHCTLAYLHKPFELEFGFKLEFDSFDKKFDKISLWHGDEHYDYQLTGTEVLKQLPIDAESRQRLIQIRTDMFADEVNALAERMFTGDITIGAWEETMKKMIRELHTSTAAIGKGGWDQMTPADWGRLGPVLKSQYKYLHDFAKYIEENKDTISLKAIQARARMYGNAGAFSSVVVQAGDVISKKLPWLPKDGSTECLVNCKCYWKLDVVGTDGDWVNVQAVWHLRPAEHCETCKERNNYVVLIKVHKTVAVPTQIG